MPSNCLASRFPNHLSNKGVIPLIKNSHTLQPGAQKPQPGPLPTGPCPKQDHSGGKNYNSVHKTENISRRAATKCNTAFTYGVEPVVDEML